MAALVLKPWLQTQTRASVLPHPTFSSLDTPKTNSVAVLRRAFPGEAALRIHTPPHAPSIALVRRRGKVRRCAVQKEEQQAANISVEESDSQWEEEESEEWDEEELDELFETYGETVKEDGEGEQKMAAEDEQRDDEESKKFAIAMARAAYDGKGADIRVLQVKSLVYWARFFVIITAFSKPQLEAIGNRLRDEAEIDFDRKPMGREREAPNSWTLLDFADVVVHVFLPPTRSFYNLEEFYGNAVPIELPFPQVNME